MKKYIILYILLLAPTLSLAHYVPGDPIHTGEVDRAVFVSALKIGSKGAEVMALQSLLKGQNNIYPEGLITGYYGPATQRAILRLQKVNGLEQVGFVGPKTRALLNKIASEGGQNYSYLYPQIIELNATSTGPNHMYVFWSSNKPTTGELFYATQTPLASTTPWVYLETSRSLTHATNLNNLATGTTYYFQVKITDQFGVSSTSTEKSITTLSK